MSDEVYFTQGRGPAQSISTNLQPVLGDFDHSGRLRSLHAPNESVLVVPRANVEQVKLEEMDFSVLPTSDPRVRGRLYVDDGILMVSRG